MLLYGCYGIQGWLTWHCNVVSKMLGTLQGGSCSDVGNCYCVVGGFVRCHVELSSESFILMFCGVVSSFQHG